MALPTGRGVVDRTQPFFWCLDFIEGFTILIEGCLICQTVGLIEQPGWCFGYISDTKTRYQYSQIDEMTHRKPLSWCNFLTERNETAPHGGSCNPIHNPESTRMCRLAH